jgi:hypothetical protein
MNVMNSLYRQIGVAADRDNIRQPDWFAYVKFGEGLEGAFRAYTYFEKVFKRTIGGTGGMRVTVENPSGNDFYQLQSGEDMVKVYRIQSRCDDAEKADVFSCRVTVHTKEKLFSQAMYPKTTNLDTWHTPVVGWSSGGERSVLYDKSFTDRRFFSKQYVEIVTKNFTSVCDRSGRTEPTAEMDIMLTLQHVDMKATAVYTEFTKYGDSHPNRGILYNYDSLLKGRYQMQTGNSITTLLFDPKVYNVESQHICSDRAVSRTELEGQFQKRFDAVAKNQQERRQKRHRELMQRADAKKKRCESYNPHEGVDFDTRNESTVIKRKTTTRTDESNNKVTDTTSSTVTRITSVVVDSGSRRSKEVKERLSLTCKETNKGSERSEDYREVKKRSETNRTEDLRNKIDTMRSTSDVDDLRHKLSEHRDIMDYSDVCYEDEEDDGASIVESTIDASVVLEGDDVIIADQEDKCELSKRDTAVSEEDDDILDLDFEDADYTPFM